MFVPIINSLFKREAPAQSKAFKSSFLKMIPLDMLQKIIEEYSTPGTLGRISAVCRIFKQIAYDDKPWAEAALRILKIKIPKEHENKARAYLIDVVTNHNACCIRFFSSDHFLDGRRTGDDTYGESKGLAYRTAWLQHFSKFKDPFILRNEIQKLFNSNDVCDPHHRTPMQKYADGCRRSIQLFNRTYRDVFYITEADPKAQNAAAGSQSDTVQWILTKEDQKKRIFFHICIPDQHFSKQVDKESVYFCLIHHFADHNISTINKMLSQCAADNMEHIWPAPLALELMNDEKIPPKQRQVALLNHLKHILDADFASQQDADHETHQSYAAMRKRCVEYVSIVLDSLDIPSCLDFQSFLQDEFFKNIQSLQDADFLQNNCEVFVVNNNHVKFCNELRRAVLHRLEKTEKKSAPASSAASLPSTSASSAAKISTSTTSEIDKKEQHSLSHRQQFSNESFEAWGRCFFEIHFQVYAIFQKQRRQWDKLTPPGYLDYRSTIPDIRTEFLQSDTYKIDREHLYYCFVHILGAIREDSLLLLQPKIKLLEDLMFEIVFRRVNDLNSFQKPIYLLEHIVQGNLKSLIENDIYPFGIIELICKTLQQVDPNWNPLKWLFTKLCQNQDFFLTQTGNKLIKTLIDLEFVTAEQKNAFVKLLDEWQSLNKENQTINEIVKTAQDQVNASNSYCAVM